MEAGEWRRSSVQNRICLKTGKFINPPVITGCYCSSVALEVTIIVSQHLSGIVLLELCLHLCLETLFPTSDLVFKVPLSPQLLPVSRSEGPFLLIQQGLEIRSHPWFIVGEEP